jgi:hypothetical protein
MITKTPSILRTPKSIPAKTFTGRNRFETPKSSYTRTSRTEVFSHSLFYVLKALDGTEVPNKWSNIYRASNVSFRVIKFLSWCIFNLYFSLLASA